jgi:hypothetical protein
VCTGFWWGSLRDRDRWGDRGIDGEIMLGWIFKKWDVGVRTGLGWLRIGIGGCEDWIGLAQDRDRWRTLVSAVMNLLVP